MGARTVPEKGRPRVMRAGTFAREMESAARAPATADPAQDSRLLVGRKNAGLLMEPLPNHVMMPMRHGIVSSAGRRQHDLKIRNSGNLYWSCWIHSRWPLGAERASYLLWWRGMMNTAGSHGRSPFP
ncbi:uncharacterized protein LOC124707529 isoform X1 [Lolium rigidum]|uniref:uncharacterized protein LOC124707529 isoform X1 n=1 Tax=Lolium rigidum TaxID=89674 RepID=UPI001F5CA276|nr:uncharacterized protein LOC124707529 isoform X1 [Lolium rigidum]